MYCCYHLIFSCSHNVRFNWHPSFQSLAELGKVTIYKSPMKYFLLHLFEVKCQVIDTEVKIRITGGCSCTGDAVVYVSNGCCY